MLQFQITPPPIIDTAVALPASKSISNRALIVYALTANGMTPQNLSDCDDTEVIVRALEHRPELIDIKAAGTAMRFMTAFLAATEGSHVLTGTERMCHRPIGPLVDALRFLGAEISYEAQEGYPPLRISGHRLNGGSLEIAGNMSSQYISALLLIGPVLRNGLELKLVGGITSRPYIELTLCVMRDFGARAGWISGDTIRVEPVGYTPRTFVIENDWSAASYWYELLALAGERVGESQNRRDEVRLEGLMDGSRQGDSAVRYLFSLLGVKTSFGTREQGVATTVTLRRHMRTLPRLDYDFVNQPDIAQTLVVTCCLCDIPFHFKGLATLKIKETDRIEALKCEMRKLGYLLRSEHDSELIWDGTRCMADDEPVIDTYEDHRMAMAFAPAALVVPGLRMNNPMVVTKSYPQFWNHLEQAGFKIARAEI